MAGRMAGKGIKCMVCEDLEVDNINGDIAAGKSLHSIAVDYGITYPTLARHRKDHVMTMDGVDGPVVISIRDVLDIPLQMRERSQLINSMIGRLLEPLMNKPNKALGHGVMFFQGSMVARLMHIQQIDEQTILKISGLLADDAPGRADLVVTEQYERIRSNLDARLLEAAGGDPEVAAQARLQLAELLMPLSEMPNAPASPFTYTDMGPVDHEHRSNGHKTTNNGSTNGTGG